MPEALRFECQSGCTECCRQKGFVYLAEADLARAATFLGMTAAAFERRYAYRTHHACACECRAIPVSVPAP